MRSYPLGPNCNTACHPSQMLFFVMSSYAHTAYALEAHISKQLADTAARKIGGCVRIGHIVNGRAETI